MSADQDAFGFACNNLKSLRRVRSLAGWQPIITAGQPAMTSVGMNHRSAPQVMGLSYLIIMTDGTFFRS